jgi:hypothetical protein
MNWKFWRQKAVTVTDEQILSVVGAWMLCNAVGAYTNTLSTSGRLDFDTWFRCCAYGENSFVERVSTECNISPMRLKNVLREYAKKNAHRSYMDVFKEEKQLHPDVHGPDPTINAKR